ncbi:hypothetical protein JTB14_006944 [Gonioctena quinquepunctata]|nr:hypothetical protein JTB14_006944 [Gonioctena quinquepunctata]
MNEPNNKTHDQSLTVDLTSENYLIANGTRLKVPTRVHRSLSAPYEKKRKILETSLESEDPNSPYRKIECPEAFTLIEAIASTRL